LTRDALELCRLGGDEELLTLLGEDRFMYGVEARQHALGPGTNERISFLVGRLTDDMFTDSFARAAEQFAA
jgi:hypothetical protein